MKKGFNNIHILLVAVSCVTLAAFCFSRFLNTVKADVDFENPEKKIVINDGGLNYAASTKSDTVASLLKEQNIGLAEDDSVTPGLEEKIYSASRVIIKRSRKIAVSEGGNTRNIRTFQDSVEKALWENKIDLGEDDFTKPARNSAIADGMKIAVTHVQITEELKEESIAFKTITDEDDSLSWRVNKVIQKGIPGIMAVKYKVVLHDGKEISRKVLEKNRTQDPVDQIATQGTLVKIGKVHTGVASWYAFRGGLFAANPWLPMGSYVRVINQDNGKSVIVKINDRGPFGNGRIIDLDKVAFSQIASIGAGVANVKMEVIDN